MIIWFTKWEKGHRVGETTITDDSTETRTHKIFSALDEACRRFDLSRPIWLDVTVEDFKRDAKARFYAESFIDDVDFDYLEMRVIEEDE